jgi:hypothetical protein
MMSDSVIDLFFINLIKNNFNYLLNIISDSWDNLEILVIKILLSNNSFTELIRCVEVVSK